MLEKLKAKRERLLAEFTSVRSQAQQTQAQATALLDQSKLLAGRLVELDELIAEAEKEAACPPPSETPSS